jgi:myosin heavy subunit
VKSNKINTHANLPSDDRPGDILPEAGIQKGATKIFLRQFAFDNIEKLRNQVLTDSAVKTQKAARRFIFRCRYIRKLECVVILQSSARRFLARKHLIIFRQRKNATRIQAMVRSSLAQRKFKAILDVCILNQKITRAYLARKVYKVLHAEVMQERKLNNAATTIQCRFRIIVARQVYSQLKSRLPSVRAAKLEGKALKAALKADKAAAISKQNTQDRKREVKTLTTQLGNANYTAEKAKETNRELTSVKAELDAALAELEMVKEELSKTSKRVDLVEKENTELQEKLRSGIFVSGEPYNSRMYADYPDLEELDEGLYTLKAQSKKGKEDLKSLLDAISLLK